MQPTLAEPSAADVKEYGAVLGHCVLCQEPVHAQDISMEDGKKPLCCQREVSEEWLPAFNDEKTVLICMRVHRRSARPSMLRSATMGRS